MSVTVAIDAMGGDRAPGEIVAGAVRAATELDVRVLLVGQEDAVGPLLPENLADLPLELVPAGEVVGMHDAPTSVRTKKDSSIVRCAQLVRDGKADAMISAGNTGATMAAALLRMGRVRGIARPAIAVTIPVPGRHPQLLVDGGSTVDCSPEWLVQFALMGREFARTRLGVDAPLVGLLSNGEEPGKGDDLRKRTFGLLEGIPGFVGNVEGRDFMRSTVDVIVTDGFTGNVALKTIEGIIRGVSEIVLTVMDSTPEAREASKVILPLLLDAARVIDPDHTGGAVLLGVRGVCVIGHGSSSAEAIVGAVRRAVECVDERIVERIEEAVAHAG